MKKTKKKHLLQAQRPAGPNYLQLKGYTDPDEIADSDCDLSGFDPELVRAYEEWADDYFGQLWRAVIITFCPRTVDSIPGSIGAEFQETANRLGR